MNELRLKINGKTVPFEQADLTFSIEQLAHTFSCTINYQHIDSPLPVQFFLNEQLIFTGQIDSTNSNANKTISITGRSLSAHLIDSRIKLNAIYNQTFDALLTLIVKEFDLSVKNKVATPLPLIPEFQINAESPLQNLAQIAKQQNLILLEQNGQIQIERPGQAAITNLILEEGKNLQELNIQRNFAHQFYHYEIQGAWDGAEAIVTYAPANSCRKKVIIADKLQDQSSCQTRAEYERDLAIAKGLTVSAQVPGLHKELTNSILNKTVVVKSTQRHFEERLLIKSIRLAVTQKGQNTHITLFRPFSEGSKNG